MKIAIYPGTFDPLTNGHLDVLDRARRLFDHIIIAIAVNSRKTPLFTQEERMALIAENITKYSNVEVLCFEGLTVDLAREKKATALIRGLRAISDFEYEFQMAQMNRQLASDIETLFLMPSQDYFFTSSTLIKSVAKYSPERLTHLVPKNVLDAFKTKFSTK